MKARFCPQCGAEVSNAYNFCPKCGTKLPEVSEAGAGSPEPAKIKSELSDSGEQAVHGLDGTPSVSSGRADEVLICPTCGFQNLAGARSCESCGAFLKGAVKTVSESGSPIGKTTPGVIESSSAEPAQMHVREKPVKKEKHKEVKTQSTPPISAKKFRLDTIRVVSIVAILLLGGILAYGIMSTKSVTPQQDNTSGADAQEQATTNQPSADVLHEIDRLRQIVDKNPADLVSTLRLSNMLQDNGFYDQAVVYYKRYIEKMPDNVDAKVDYGVTLFESGHTQEAIDQLTQALKMNPKHQIGFFNLGIVYLNAGEFDKANAAFKKCVELDPNSDIGKKAQQTIEQHANIKN